MKTYGRGRRETGTCLRPSLVPCSALTPLSAAVLLSQAADTDTADTAEQSTLTGTCYCKSCGD